MMLKSKPAAQAARKTLNDASTTPRIYEVNGFRLTGRVVGTCETAEVSDEVLTASGFLDGAKKVELGLDMVVLVDTSRRLVASAPIFGNAWTITARATDLAHDQSAASASVYAVASSRRQFYQFLDKGGLETAYATLANGTQNDRPSSPSLRSELRALIEKTVNTPFISKSIHGGISTGSGYQTLILDDGSKTKGREDREAYLRMVDLSGKNVIDLGCNMGEMSRTARSLGAASVDGFEYEPSFVEIGRAVNALNGVTGVSLYQADITQAGFFKGRSYDVSLALNVWVYIERQFSDFPAMSPLVLFETHTLDHGLKFYYDRVLSYYPHATTLALSDFGDDPRKTRAFIALAQSEDALAQFAKQQYLTIKPYFPNRFIEQVGVLDERGARQLAAHCYAEIGGELPKSKEAFGFGHSRYFKTLLAGFHQYQSSGRVLESDNIYAEYLKAGINRELVDPKLKEIVSDDGRFQRKIANKFEDMEFIFSGNARHVSPILLYPDDSGKLEFEDVSGRQVRCRDIDGHHRFFACQLLGVDKIHYRLI